MFKSIRMLPMHLFLAVLGLGMTSNSTLADPVTVPNTFSSGTPAVAAEVNANFTAVKTAVDDNDNRIAALEKTIAALQNTITALQGSLSTLEGNSVLALDDNLIYTMDANGYPTAQFTGVNVQVVNGSGTTAGDPDGLGNLIVGYNPARTSGWITCSIGSATTETDCGTAGGVWAVSHKSGSHNLVIGNRNNYSSYGGLVAGYGNTISARYASVSGSSNTASAYSSSVSGGSNNTASGDSSSISGGSGNTASGYYSSISGGRSNTASVYYSSISGGSGNTASGYYSSVSGGFNRRASGTNDWRAGSLFEEQ